MTAGVLLEIRRGRGWLVWALGFKGWVPEVAVLEVGVVWCGFGVFVGGVIVDSLVGDSGVDGKREGSDARVNGGVGVGAAMPRGAKDGSNGDAWLYSKWVEAPLQDRSARTFFRFLDAAEVQLADRSWQDVSINDLVRGADASVGSFYNRFTDKEALLNCLIDRLDNECVLTVDAISDELELCPALVGEAPALVLSFIMRLCTDRGGVLRAHDLAQRLAKPVMDADSFAGLMPGFEAALVRLVAAVPGDARLQAFAPEAVLKAFRQGYWLARDTLLYSGKTRFDDQALHQSLVRHFWASLEA